ncbi:MAG: LysR family transcriptional regulator [Breznakibacter sp.]
MVEVVCSISIKVDGTCYLNPLKIALLKEVDRCGSLNQAAKNLAMSYQHAWRLVGEVNTLSSLPIIAKQRGGAQGGGTDLTEYGRKILNEIRVIEKQVNGFTQRLNSELAM